MEVVEALGRVSQASSPFLLVLAVYAFLTGRVVARWQYDQAEARAEVWRQLYEREKALLEKTLMIAERQVTAREGGGT